MGEETKTEKTSFDSVLHRPFKTQGMSPVEAAKDAPDIPDEFKATEEKSETKEEPKDAETPTETKAEESKADDPKAGETEGEEKKVDRNVPLSVHLAQRHKLQTQIKEKNEELQKQLENTLDYHDDPEKYTKTEVTNAMTVMQKQFRNQIVDMSEVMAEKVYPDYKEVFKEFQKIAQQDQSILDYVLNECPSPAFAAYDIAKAQLTQAEYGNSPQEMEKKIRAKVEKEQQEKGRKSQAEKLEMRDKQPTSLNSARAAGGDHIPEFVAPTFADVLAKKGT